MKKILLMLLVCVVVLSITFIGIGCKKTAPLEEALEEAPAEEEAPETTEPFSWGEVDEWKIPAFSGVTGVGAAWGEMGVWTRDYAAEVVNAEGGIAGKPIVIDWYDDGWDQTKAATEMSKVVPWALASLGPWNDISDHGAMPIAIDNELFVFVGETGASIALQYQPWCFHNAALDEDVYPQGIKAWLKKNPDIKKVSMFVEPEHSMWVEISEIVAQTVEEMGLEVGEQIEIPDGTVDFGPPAVKAIASGADGFWFACNPTFIAKALIELQDRGGITDNRKAIIFPHGEDPSFWDLGKDRFEGVYRLVLLNINSQNPKYLDYINTMQERHDPDAPYFMFTPQVDEVYVLKAAIEDMKITGDPAKLAEERIMIRDYSRNLEDFPFLTGIADVVDGFKQNPVYILQAENNQFVMLSRVDEEGNDIPID